MDIKDILSVGLTAEDFDTCIEGLDAIPEKGLSQELAMSMMAAMGAVGSSPHRMEEVKKTAINRIRDMEKKAKARADDLVILKSKLVLLKRLLLSNEAVKAANDILHSTPPPGSAQIIDYHIAA